MRGYKGAVGSFEDLNGRIVACRRCPRLRAWCSQVAREKRRAFAGEEYWGLPVPNFGDPEAVGLIVGLAPAAHGANRTGRMFTGDRSGEWLYRALHRAGLASQATAVSREDGLVLRGVMVTALAHCAPPANKPTPGEVRNCRGHLADTLRLRPWRGYLCLGSMAWEGLHRALAEAHGDFARSKFGHGASYEAPGGARVFGSYHPSQQNTFTGKLTEAMLDEVVGRFAAALEAGHSGPLFPIPSS